MEWTGQVYADCPAVAVETYIEAPPERVWDLVSRSRQETGPDGSLSCLRISSRTRAASALLPVALMTAPTRGPAAASLPALTLAATSG